MPAGSEQDGIDRLRLLVHCAEAAYTCKPCHDAMLRTLFLVLSHVTLPTRRNSFSVVPKQWNGPLFSS